MPSAAKTRVLGIDLGTSNSAIAVADAGASAARALPVTQVLGPGRLGERRTFASALYFPVTGQFPPDSLRPPWSDRELRRFADGTGCGLCGSARPAGRARPDSDERENCHRG